MYKNKSLFTLVTLFFAGLISVFAYAPFSIKIMLVLSLLPFLFILYRFNQNTTKKEAFLYGFIYGIGFFSGQLYWMFYSLYIVIDAGFLLSIIAFSILMFFLALYIGFVSLIYLKLKSKHISINFLLLFPSIWVLSEWTRGWLFTGFPWSDVSYTQVSTDFLKGYFPVFGSYAVSWLIIAIIAGIFVVLLGFLNRSQLQHKRSLQVSILFISIIILVGTSLLDKTYTIRYGRAMSVALVQGNVAQGVKWNSDKFLGIYEGLIAKARANLVIIPETAITTFSEYLPRGYLDELTRLAQNNGANLIIGIPKIIDKEKNYVNSATLLTNFKHPYYAKYHLVPFGEYIPFKRFLAGIYNMVALPMVGFSPGAQNQAPLVVSNQKVAFNICYENGFNTELIDGAKNSTVMANISDMVWYGKTIAQDEHLEISQARALENQRYFIQDTNTGDTAIINPRGEIQSILPTFTQDILTDQIFGMIGETPFEKVRNYPIIIWCSLIIAFAIILKIRKIK